MLALRSSRPLPLLRLLTFLVWGFLAEGCTSDEGTPSPSAASSPGGPVAEPADPASAAIDPWSDPPPPSVIEDPPYSPRESVTFTRDIAPILFENCSGCHRPGEAAPFSLLSYRDARRRARQMVQVTQSGYMPPWLPVPGHGAFEGERRLTETQLGLLEQWVEAGSPEGDPAELPDPPEFAEGWQLGKPDLVVTMPKPYALPKSGDDVFRNFLIPVSLDGPRFVRAVEFRPGNARVVHHAVVNIDETPSSRLLDAKDEEAGFGGMGGRTRAHSPGGHFVGWTPGKVARPVPEELSWRLDPGTDFVFQLHLLPSGKSETVQSKIGLYFTDVAPTRAPVVMRLGSRTQDIPPGDSDYTVTDSYTVPVDVTVVSVYPHAHYLGKVLEAFAVRPDGSRSWLLRIDDWDFNWQDSYTYAEPVDLPRGSRIHARIVYDNSEENVRNPHVPPKRVRFGPGTYDEMGDIWLQLVADSESDHEALEQDLGRRDREQWYESLRVQETWNPQDAEVQHDLGVIHRDRGETAAAIERFERAIALDPRYPEGLYDLALVHHRAGRLPQAVEYYERALEAEPDFYEALSNLGAALSTAGEHTRALTYFRRAMAIRRDDPLLLGTMAKTMAQLGETAEAERLYRRAIQVAPDDEATRVGYASFLFGRRDGAGAEAQFREALRVAPNSPRALNGLGVVLGAQGRFEDAIRQFEHALRADPRSLNAHRNLARAYAQIGRRADAQRHLAEAERLLREARARGAGTSPR